MPSRKQPPIGVATTAAETPSSGLPHPSLPQYCSAQLTATVRVKPRRMENMRLDPVSQPQLIVQLHGVTHMTLIRQGQRHQYHVQPGSLFLNTAQQLPYDLAWQGLGTETIRSLEVHLTPALLRQTATAAGHDADRWELLPGACLVDPLVHQLAVSLAATVSSLLPVDCLYVDTIAQMLAAQLVHCYSARPVPGSAGRAGLAPARYQQLKDYIHASLGDSITLEDLAAVACLSPYHFCRVFRQTTGLSPHQYVTQQRLDQARRLLQHSALSVAQVARAVGYQSASHFSRLFQRHTGRLPTAWRH